MANRGSGNDARTELAARTSIVDVFVNAAVSQFINRQRSTLYIGVFTSGWDRPVAAEVTIQHGYRFFVI
jgi:hypothetical protein